MTKYNTDSLLRTLQYEEISKLNLNGSIVDFGGSKKSGYQNLIKGNNIFTTVNISEEYSYDIYENLEENFINLKDKIFDHALAINFLEHIYNYKNFIKNASFIIKTNGKFIITVPFLFKVHGSPSDYHRYTPYAFKKVLEENGFEIELIKPIGVGFFSILYQIIFLKFSFLMKLTIFTDKKLNLIKKYNKYFSQIPLGYFIVAIKK